MAEKKSVDREERVKEKPSLDLPPQAVRAKLLFGLALVCALFIFVLAWFKDDGFRSVMEIDEKIQAEEAQLKKLKHENELLKKRIETAHNDRYQVEKFAREKLNLAKEGELIFRFKNEDESEF